VCVCECACMCVMCGKVREVKGSYTSKTKPELVGGTKQEEESK